ncbi:transketolase [Janthinobacterium lividum]|uniref:Transketolase n=1 Tax=Janthinobacterium lividum TaxID=29581 RepID=A0ABU0XYM6_9BURK|nr:MULTISPECIES: transketolase [Janthinobacterium]MCC7698512.1 transketolase [Janthinobacterium sp. EB271-G4-7A]MCC7714740.1 transketolase [Janthinobacterium lividum]MDQ4628030.1 transketolase [Janthinobacterium lividum]MDQ4676848.1 transketolase [Janthinobacterium lividum]MDQ4686680.1 transketolase [Janthinobacterium lividum]
MTTTLPTTKMANAIRALAMDAVQKANSGHPGMPMGMAEIAVALWSGHYRHNPANPKWQNRDRFLLSNGHGSMLHYALLHLTGYDLSMDDIKAFRQMHSKTPGHPEVDITPGIETTTGPLGQGIANAVGMALSEQLLAAEFNKPGYDIVNHYTYAFVGDGCLMEGISHEVCALAGTLGLNKLIALYDDNGISIDGKVEGWFTDDTPARFEAYGWNVIRAVDGHDVAAVAAAIAAAKTASKPTLICCKTIIGKGSPNLQGGDKVHGAALGDKEIAAVREYIGWDAAPFEMPADVYAAWDAKKQGALLEADWNERFAAYSREFPQQAAELSRRMQGELPAAFETALSAAIASCVEKKENIATRKASQNAIQALASSLPEFLGGSADLTGSNLTNWKECVAVRSGQPGNHINYGVREFGMSAIMNGITLHGGYIPFGATFLTFSDYSRNALRMAALMKLRSIFVFTHDSIGLGEDGPTHQSVEHVSSMRLIPNLDNWRPCDTVESAAAWGAAVRRKDGPSTLIFSRQNLPYQERSAEQIDNIYRGGYVLNDVADAKAILIATGSEVELAVAAASALAAEGINVRVVSMPSTDVYDRQDAAYKASVLTKGVPRVAIEAGVTSFWYKYVGLEGAVVGIDTFGESAPAGVLFKHFGFTVENVVAKVKAVIAG